MLAEAIRDAYADLFQVNTKAEQMTPTEVKNKLKTLTQGQYGESVLDKMAATFKALVQMADFVAAPPVSAIDERDERPPQAAQPSVGSPPIAPLRISGLVYTINLALPESRDQTVYDALFKSLKEHLFS